MKNFFKNVIASIKETASKVKNWFTTNWNSESKADKAKVVVAAVVVAAAVVVIGKFLFGAAATTVVVDLAVADAAATAYNATAGLYALETATIFALWDALGVVAKVFVVLSVSSAILCLVKGDFVSVASNIFTVALILVTGTAWALLLAAIIVAIVMSAFGIEPKTQHA